MLVNAFWFIIFTFSLLFSWWKTRELKREMSASVHMWASLVKKNPTELQHYQKFWRMYLLGSKKFDAVFLEKYNGTEKQAHLQMKAIRMCLDDIENKQKDTTQNFLMNLYKRMRNIVLRN